MTACFRSPELRWTWCLVAISLSIATNSAGQNFPGFHQPKATPELVAGAHDHTAKIYEVRKLLADESYAAACQLLDELLGSATEDYFVQKEGLSWRTLLFNEIKELPSAAAEMFELQLGTAADASLSSVLKARDIVALDQLARRFFGTGASAEATILHARYLLDYGHYVAAAHRLQALNEMADLAKRFEPEVSLLQAICWLRAGRERLAERVLRRLYREHHIETIQLAGQSIRWVNDESDVLGWMHRWLGNMVPASHSQKTIAELRLVPRWQIDVSDSFEQRQLVHRIATECDPKRTVLSPLITDNWVVVRSAQRVLGIDPQGGKRCWAFPPDSDSADELPLTHAVVSRTMRGGRQQRDCLTSDGRDIHRRVWLDQLFGGVATDGSRMFLLDQLIQPADYSHGQRVRRADSPFLDPNQNRLVAIDIQRQGAALWTLGDSDSNVTELDESQFLSPPVVVNDQLVVVAYDGKEITLVLLDPTDGRLLWTQPLLIVDVPPQGFDRLRGARLHAAGKMLVCWPTPEFVFGVDMSTRRLAWHLKLAGAHSQQDEADKLALFPLQHHSFRSSGRRDQLAEWNRFLFEQQHRGPGIACSDNYCVLITDDELSCLDIHNGERRWTKPRLDHSYPACFYRDAVLVVGAQKMAMLSLADGQPTWQPQEFTAIPSFGLPNGAGVRLGNLFLFATTSRELIAVDLRNGRTKRENTGFAIGNLAMRDNLLISQSATALVAWTVAEESAGEQSQFTETESDAAPQESSKPEAPTCDSDVSAEVAELVEDLRSDEFIVREAAQRRLLQLGPTAENALQNGADSLDLEVRWRCRLILKTIQEHQLAERLAVFRKNEPGTEAVLPGWNDFKQRIGEDDTARELYALAYEAEHELFDALPESPKKLVELITNRCTQLSKVRQHNYLISFDSRIALLILATRSDVAQAANEKDTLVNGLATLWQHYGYARMGNADYADPIKRLWRDLFAQHPKSDSLTLLQIGLSNEIPESVRIARNILSQAPDQRTATAASAIGRFGEPQDKELLLNLFENTTVVSNHSINNRTIIVQLRDVALAACITLSGKQPAEFGFEDTHGGFPHAMGGFSDEDKRSAAFTKWEMHAEQNQDSVDTATETESDG